MGYIIAPKCKCINEMKMFNIGVGINDCDKDYQYELAYCEGCKDFKLSGESKICECGVPLKTVYTADLVDEDIRITCPRCGNEMEIEFIGFWD